MGRFLVQRSRTDCVCVSLCVIRCNNNSTNNELRGLSPHANYTDRAAAAGSAKLVPTFADRGVSRGQRKGSPQPLISLFSRPGAATFFIQVAPQLTSRG